MATKPTQTPRIATNALTRVEPAESGTAGVTTKDTGVLPGAKTPAQYMNWWLHNIYLWCLYLEDIAAQNFTASGADPVGPWTGPHTFTGGGGVATAAIAAEPSGAGNIDAIRGVGADSGVGGRFYGGSDGYGLFVQGGSHGAVISAGTSGAGEWFGVLGFGAGGGGGVQGTGSGNGPGVQGTGSGNGPGGLFQGGSTGIGITAQGGASFGLGAQCTGGTGSSGVYGIGGAGGGLLCCGVVGAGSPGANSPGVLGIATGNAPGVMGSGDPVGSGVGGNFQGSDTKAGCLGTGGPVGGIGVQGIGGTAGAGVQGTGGISGGPGVRGQGGDFGDGVIGIGGTGNTAGGTFTGHGTGAGVTCVGGATGPGVRATGTAPTVAAIIAHGAADVSKGVEITRGGLVLSGDVIGADVDPTLPSVVYPDNIIHAKGRVSLTGAGGGGAWAGFNVDSTSVTFSSSNTVIHCEFMRDVPGTVVVVPACTFGQIEVVTASATEVAFRVMNPGGTAFIDLVSGGFPLTIFFLVA